MARRKRHNRDEDYETIAMLLDVDHFYGEGQGRLAPVIIFLLIGLLPLLLYVYYGVYLFIPLRIFLPIFVIYFIRVWMKTLGHENARLEHFKKTLHDEYSDINELVRIKTIHSDGGVEYIDGVFCYVIVLYNKTLNDESVRGPILEKFLSQAIGTFDNDIYSQNIIESRTLATRYSRIKLFTNSDAARDFIDIIDHNRGIIQKSSLLTRTVLVIKGRRSDWKDIKANIDAALKSNSAKIFKTSYVVQEEEEINSIISRDVDGNINISSVLSTKYKTGNYRGSKVVSYDSLNVAEEEHIMEDTMGFHVKYEEDQK
jgi:hypothetical protein